MYVRYTTLTHLHGTLWLRIRFIFLLVRFFFSSFCIFLYFGEWNEKRAVCRLPANVPNDNRNKRMFETNTKARTPVKHGTKRSTHRRIKYIRENTEKYTFYDDRSLLHRQFFVFTAESQVTQLEHRTFYCRHTHTFAIRWHTSTNIILNWIYKPFSTCSGVLSLSRFLFCCFLNSRLYCSVPFVYLTSVSIPMRECFVFLSLSFFLYGYFLVSVCCYILNLTIESNRKMKKRIKMPFPFNTAFVCM